MTSVVMTCAEEGCGQEFGGPNAARELVEHSNTHRAGAGFTEACAVVDGLDVLGRVLLLAFLLGKPGMPGRILAAVAEMRANGQIETPPHLRVVRDGAM